MSSVAFHTLGCKVNQYDTQAMLELFRQKGYDVVPFEGDSDIYVINTCTVTGTGDKKSMQLTRRLIREHPDSQIILCGCLAQRKGEELLKTGARLIIGTQRRHQVVELYEKAMAQNIQICAVEPLGDDIPFEKLAISHQEGHTRATMKIQEGCNNHCTYCIIPSVRGPIRSRPMDEIADEAARLAKQGFQEIVVTGIHLTSYGKDISDVNNVVTLSDALEVIQNTPGITRIRLGSLEPVIATKEFVDRISRMDKICPQFHLALQSGSDTVLARMARRYNTQMYNTAVANIRKKYPDAAITTDILTGFPGETTQEFEETRQMIEKIGFAKIHVFPYSPREGTKAAVMKNQLSNTEKDNRCRILIADGEKAGKKYREGYSGKVRPVLLEEKNSDGLFCGYTPEYIHTAVTVSRDDCSELASELYQGKTVDVLLCQVTDEGMTGILYNKRSREK